MGVVLRCEIRDADWAAWALAQRGEASINQLLWIDALGETVDLAEFGYWSQLCWRSLFPVMVRAQPAYRVLHKKPFRAVSISLPSSALRQGGLKRVLQGQLHPESLPADHLWISRTTFEKGC